MKKDIWIAGIARGHNASVCLLKNGEIIFSLEEERLSRRKWDGGPFAGMIKILEYTDKIDYLVVAHTHPLEEMEGKVDFTGDNIYTGMARKLGLIDRKANLWPHPQVIDMSRNHHKLHTACAFYRSGFDSATGIVVDGAGTNTITISDAAAVTGIITIETYALAAGAQTFTLGAAAQSVTADGTGDNGAIVIDTDTQTTVSGTFTSAGNDTIKLNVETNNTNISTATTTDVDTIDLANDVDVTMTVTQHGALNAAAGDNTITLSDAGALTGDANVETYVLANGGGTTITIGTTGQNVTTGNGADTIDVGDKTADGVFTTSATSIIKLSDGANITGVDAEGNGAGTAFTANNLTFVSGASATMTAAQNNSFTNTITAAGTNTSSTADDILDFSERNPFGEVDDY